MIIDCFPFFDELELLEIRLNELASVVDRFVLSEATLTFSGKPKPLYFRENRERFSGFPIEHVVIDDYTGIDITDPWAMDWGQKQRGLDAMLRRLCPSGDDMVILSDCDEIPRAEAVSLANSQSGWHEVVPHMPLYYYWLNCRQQGDFWRGGKWMRTDKWPCFQDIRQGRGDATVFEAGWHFSYMGNIHRKIGSWAHVEYDKPPFNTPGHIARCKREGKDLFNRNVEYEFLSDLSYLPQYVLDNRERFEHLICKEHSTS